MVKASCRTFAIGARQLVVQDALEMIVCLAGSYVSSLTPMTIVTSSFFAGAEMITFLAPPATCTLAFSASVNRPVDSSTTSAPRSPHGSLLGSRSASALKVCPPTVISSAVALTSCGSRPRMLSYLSRWARLALSVRSLTPTSWMSAPRSRTARKKLRPIRPKPLMPTRMVTGHLSLPQGRYALGRPPSVPASSPNSANPIRTTERDAGQVRRLRVDGEHLRGYRRLGVRDPEVAGPLVGQGQQPADPPGDRVLGQRRVGQRAQLLQRGLAVLQAQPAGAGQVVGRGVAEDLQGPGDPGGGGHRGTRRAAQVGVVEVGQAVGGGPDLAAHPPLLPGQHAGVRTQPGQQVGDRVAVLDHDPVHAPDLARLGGDADPAGGTDQRQRRLRARAGDLQRAGAAGLGERAVRHERAPPGGHRAAHAGRDHVRRQAAHRPPAHVQQAGLPGQRLAVLDHPADVVAALTQPAGGQDVDLTGVPVDLGDLPAQPAGDVAGVELGLHDHPARDDVQPTGEAQQRGHLRGAAARLGTSTRLSSSLTAAVIAIVSSPHVPHVSQRPAASIPDRAAASADGSCRAPPSSMATGASTSRAPSDSAARRTSSGSPTALPSARTTSARRPGRYRVNACRWSGTGRLAVSSSAARLRVTTRRAGLPRIAAASSGTSRCGITLVYHEPGPKTSQSAVPIAVTASAHAGGTAGEMRTTSTCPAVTATSCWPWISRSLPPASSTSASIRSGTRDIGSTRPLTRSIAAASSSATTGSGYSCISPHSTRLPTACPASGPAPANRCWNSRAAFSSPASAASAWRRSPGGSTPRSSRSRPLDPPSSATVTTAVTSSPGICRRARSDADSPCPPPKATTLIPGPGRGVGRRPPAAGRAGAGPAPRRWRRCGACRRCSQPRR